MSLHFAVKKVKQSKTRRKFPIIDAMVSPKWLSQTLIDTNTEQKQAVRDIGFSRFLDGAFDFESIPVKLGRFVVEMFDCEECKFKFSDGRSIKVTKELIHDITGLPFGGSPIDPKDRSFETEPIVMQFRKQYSTSKLPNYFSKPLNDIMRKMTTGDRQFKLNFLVLATSLLVECTKAGGVNQKLLMCIPEKDEEIRAMDWCGYILDAMIRCTRGFKFKNNYNGPFLVMVVSVSVTFIVYFYIVLL